MIHCHAAHCINSRLVGQRSGADGEAVGIVGTITGFASICLNGLEVHLDERVPISENGVPTRSEALAVGQFVSIDALGSPLGPVARSIAIVYALAGPITAVRDNGRVIEVMGRQVTVDAATRIADGGSDLTVGQPVKVSGQVNAAGQLVGTRIQPAPALAEASVVGTATTIGAGTQVGGVVVSGKGMQGDLIARGTWNGRELVIHETLADPTFRFAEGGRRVVVEGLVQRAPAGGTLKALGRKTHFDQQTRISGATTLRADTYVRIEGRFAADGSIRADRIDCDHGRDQCDRHLQALAMAIESGMVPSA